MTQPQTCALIEGAIWGVVEVRDDNLVLDDGKTVRLSRAEIIASCAEVRAHVARKRRKKGRG